MFLPSNRSVILPPLDLRCFFTRLPLRVVGAGEGLGGREKRGAQEAVNKDAQIPERSILEAERQEWEQARSEGGGCAFSGGLEAGMGQR